MKLAEWLQKKEMAVPAFAALTGLSQRSVFRYLSGERRPTPKVLQEIYKITEGDVTANDFHQQESKTNAPVRRRSARSIARTDV